MIITRTEWERKLRHGYADHDAEGRPRVLTMDRESGATVLATVEIAPESCPGCMNELAEGECCGECVPCPCCGDMMMRLLVVCWICYRWTNRLTPGTYMDGSTPSTITAADVARWDAARLARLS